MTIDTGLITFICVCAVYLKMERINGCIALIAVSAIAFAIQTPETREIKIGLERDGNLINTEDIPRCGSDSIIHLVSYKYHQLDCLFAFFFCSSVRKDPLLPEEEFHLHQMCSMQHQCRNLSFPLRSEVERSRTNSIIIKYECIDQKRLENICEATTRTSSDPIYLTSVDIEEPFKECRCSISSGNFTISATDVRLNDNMDNKCSPATLQINHKEYVCNETRNDYGAVFIKTPGMPLSNAYVSLRQNSKTSLPDMVLMIIQPESSLRIMCLVEQTTAITNENRSTSVGRSISTTKLPSSSTVLTNVTLSNSTQENSTESCPTVWRTVLFIAINVITMIICTGIILWKCRRYPHEPCIRICTRRTGMATTKGIAQETGIRYSSSSDKSLLEKHVQM